MEALVSDFLSIETLGQGAGGVVWKAVHRPSRRIIALKKMPYNQDEKLKKQIMIELQTLSACDHENILKSYAAFDVEGKINIALEFMDAGSLAHILARVIKIPEVVLGIISTQILHGLAYLHKHHVMHRDIKPANILFNLGGIVKLADFGVSGQLVNTADLKTTFVGTLIYMSPERLEGKAYQLDTDLWSLGILLVECATGICPVTGSGFWQVLQQVKNEKLVGKIAGFSNEFNDFVSILLNKDEKQRSSAAELLNHPWILNHANMKKKNLTKWLKTFHK